MVKIISKTIRTKIIALILNLVLRQSTSLTALFYLKSSQSESVDYIKLQYTRNIAMGVIITTRMGVVNNNNIVQRETTI